MHYLNNSNGGGGGNRTRVPKYFSKSVYTHSLSFNFAVLNADRQAFKTTISK